jgi:hypothetical protein
MTFSLLGAPPATHYLERVSTTPACRQPRRKWKCKTPIPVSMIRVRHAARAGDYWARLRWHAQYHEYQFSGRKYRAHTSRRGAGGREGRAARGGDEFVVPGCTRARQGCRTARCRGCWVCLRQSPVRQERVNAREHRGARGRTPRGASSGGRVQLGAAVHFLSRLFLLRVCLRGEVIFSSF